MKINKETVLETAEMLRFEISSDELDNILNQANDMVSIIDSIQNLDTEHEHRTNVMAEQINQFAKYDYEDSVATDFLNSFENFDGDFFSIKKVRDNEQDD